MRGGGRGSGRQAGRNRTGQHSKPQSTTKQYTTTFYGITNAWDVVRIAVYVKGTDVWLSGPRGPSHPVHASNERTREGWMREARLVWNLGEMIEVPLLSLDARRDEESTDALRKKALEGKLALQRNEPRTCGGGASETRQRPPAVSSNAERHPNSAQRK